MTLYVGAVEMSTSDTKYVGNIFGPAGRGYNDVANNPQTKAFYCGTWYGGTGSLQVDIANIYENYHWGQWPYTNFLSHEDSYRGGWGMKEWRRSSFAGTAGAGVFGNSAQYGNFSQNGGTTTLSRTYSGAPIYRRTIQYNFVAYCYNHIYVITSPGETNVRNNTQTVSSLDGDTSFVSGVHLLTAGA